MARKAAAQEENHWPGFVDVLSTMVMVVTFLLIILGIVIFVLAQNVAKKLVENAQHQGASTAPVDQTFTAEGNTREQTSNPSSGGGASAPVTSDSSSNDVFKAVQGDPLTQDQKVEEDNNLTVTSKKVESEERIVIAPEERPQQSAPVAVTSSASMLTLEFPAGVVRIDAASDEAINTFLQASNVPRGSKIEIRSFARTGSTAVSEARRIAFYRAMSARNQLLKQGFNGDSIEIVVKDTSVSEETNVVRMFVKP